jgi:serine/threonine protein kinase
MVMAYESGHALQEHIGRLAARGSRASEAFIQQVFAGVCAGLREVHANKLLHLDLKPANVYLRVDGTPILLDFGAARQTINTDIPTLAPMYTPGFAAPELYVKGQALGPWTDIYSIGAAIVACMTGAPPQPADQRRSDDQMPARFAQLAGSGAWSPGLLVLVRSCLALDPLVRPQSVFEVQKALQALPPQGSTKDVPEDAQRATSGWRGLVGRIGAFGRNGGT